MPLPDQNMKFPVSRYCPTIYNNMDYIPPSGYRKYRRVKALSGLGFDYLNPSTLGIARPCDMQISEETPTQQKYAAVCQRVRAASASRARSTISNDRGSIGPGDLAAFPEANDLRLARSRMSQVNLPYVEEFPAVRARSNQYENWTHNMIRYGAMCNAV